MSKLWKRDGLGKDQHTHSWLNRQYLIIYTVGDDHWPLCVPTGHLFHKFGITESDWYRIKQSIDSKCRTAWRRKQRGQSLAVKSFSKRTPRSSAGGKVQIIIRGLSSMYLSMMLSAAEKKAGINYKTFPDLYDFLCITIMAHAA